MKKNSKKNKKNGKCNRVTASSRSVVLRPESSEVIELKQKLRQQYDEMSYDDALETVAALIERKCYDPDILYIGAQVYYLQGDYRRAASWVNNTLHFAADHVGARLLLARICLLEDRIDDAMEIYTYVLKNYGTQLSKADKADIQNGVDYTFRTDKEWLQANYPKVAKFLNSRNKTVENMAAAETETREQMKVEDESIETVKEKIKQAPVSVREKIELFNQYAVGYFAAKSYPEAQTMLAEALCLDSRDETSLRNMAILTKCMGDTEKAMQYAGFLPKPDFMLLKILTE